MMKSKVYLLFPLGTTFLNLLLALWIIRSARADLIPASRESSIVQLCGITGKSTIYCDGTGAIIATADFAEHRLPSVDTRNDSCLQKMPDYNFMACVQRDVALFYEEEEGSMVEVKPKFKGQASKFVNMSPERLDLYWQSGHNKPGTHMAAIGPFESGGTSSHPGHMFYFARKGKPSEPVCRFLMVTGTSVYYYDPFSEGDSQDPSRCVTSEPPRSFEDLSEDEVAQFEAHVVNQDFSKAYKEFTGGSEWLSMFPKSPPRHHIWSADYFGQEHIVQTRETHFLELPPVEELTRLDYDAMRRNDQESIPLTDYRKDELIMNVTIKAVSCEPRVFEIPHLLSDVEVDHLLDIATGKHLVRSTTGLRGSAGAGAISSTRTSTNSWISRYSSPIVDAIYRRVADVLLLDESLLRTRLPDERPELPTKQPLSEDLQIVHYDVGQEYTAHHDFGYPDTRNPESPSRSINILLYLNDDMEGGGTSFPRWRNAHTDEGIDVVPVKGKAALFYMVGPDGNRDDLSQHAALPVRSGEKYMANLWIWDPVKL